MLIKQEPRLFSRMLTASTEALNLFPVVYFTAPRKNVWSPTDKLPCQGKKWDKFCGTLGWKVKEEGCATCKYCWNEIIICLHGFRRLCGDRGGRTEAAEGSRGGRPTAEEEEVPAGVSGADRKGRGGRGERGRVPAATAAGRQRVLCEQVHPGCADSLRPRYHLFLRYKLSVIHWVTKSRAFRSMKRNGFFNC